MSRRPAKAAMLIVFFSSPILVLQQKHLHSKNKQLQSKECGNMQETWGYFAGVSKGA